MLNALILLLRRPLIASLILTICSMASATEFVRPRPLIEYADILLAQELDTAVTVLNDRVGQCVDSGAGGPSECFCRHPAEVATAKASYEKTLQARPKWQGRILYWKNPENLASRNLVMPAIDHQLRTAPLSCNSLVPK